MSSHARGQRCRYRKAQGRHVWVFSDLNHDLRPEQIAKIITAAGLEQARLEAEARAEHEANRHPGDEVDEAEEGDHA